jgi:hypothetical protein
MCRAESQPKSFQIDVNAPGVVVCPCAVVLWALAGSVSRLVRNGSSYGLGILASKQPAKYTSESQNAVPPVQYARGFSSRRVLRNCTSSRAAWCCELRVGETWAKRVVKLSLLNLSSSFDPHSDRCTSRLACD